jgi:hypothetical protein
MGARTTTEGKMKDFNHLIDMKNWKLKRYYLWQVNHYHYRIADFHGKVYSDLTDTKCEQAKEQFKTWRPNAR